MIISKGFTHLAFCINTFKVIVSVSFLANILFIIQKLKTYLSIPNQKSFFRNRNRIDLTILGILLHLLCCPDHLDILTVCNESRCNQLFRPVLLLPTKTDPYVYIYVNITYFYEDEHIHIYKYGNIRAPHIYE